MKIERLYIKNIGPFKEATLEFPTQVNKETGEEPVTIITGRNGAGKSIIIDAIRAALSGMGIERNIVANDDDFKIEMSLNYDGTFKIVETCSFSNGHIRTVDWGNLGTYFLQGYKLPGKVYDWVVDYWSSKLPTDSFSLKTMNGIKNEEVLAGVLNGKKTNVELTNFICQIDYLRTSEMTKEKMIGEVMYKKLKEIVNLCLENGEFKYVRRSDLTPIIEQNKTELSLEKLSSGNIFMIEHLVMLMCKMYSVAMLNGIPAEEMFEINGLLLADEVENHMHPLWQKRILGIIRKLFPNIQIILTTHSPFVVASMDGAKIYTCVPQTGYSEVRDETDKYGHMPVEEILQSEVFSVNPFNEEIAALMKKRKELINAGKIEEGRLVGKQLYDINPEYFSYLNPGAGGEL
ncbi:MAG: AAA family ATPase [Bacteroidaceae bacterium]|nr:AAA family ATPase [Bacteroidaceae bacterium]